MEGFPYNGKTVNSSGSLASIVYLPDAHATMDLVVSERIAVTISGSTGFGRDLLGDISKVLNIGGASTEMSVEATGTLTLNQIGFLGEAAGDFGFDPAGDMTTLSVLPSGSTDKTWEVTGSMIRHQVMMGSLTSDLSFNGVITRMGIFGPSPIVNDLSLSGALGAIQYLSASTQMALSPSGSLSLFRRNYIGYASVSTSIDVSGVIRLTGGLFGNANTSLEPSGELSRGLRTDIPSAGTFIGIDATGAIRGILRMQGNAGISLDATGTVIRMQYIAGGSITGLTLGGLLSNNAGIEDLSGFLMIRRATNREMTR